MGAGGERRTGARGELEGVAGGRRISSLVSPGRRRCWPGGAGLLQADAWAQEEASSSGGELEQRRSACSTSGGELEQKRRRRRALAAAAAASSIRAGSNSGGELQQKQRWPARGARDCRRQGREAARQPARRCEIHLEARGREAARSAGVHQ